MRRSVSRIAILALACATAAGCSSTGLTGLVDGQEAPVLATNAGVETGTIVVRRVALPAPTVFATQGTAPDGSGRPGPQEAVVDPLMQTGDPFEGFNRGIHDFNRTIDVVLATPISDLYGTLVPGFARQGIRNGVRNLSAPRDFANYVLQGRPGRAAETAMRFVLNSTLGIGGLVDIGAQAGLPYQPTDFGVTLARYGVPAGNYVVTPLLGPSTTRDSIGEIVDTAFSILFWAGVFSDAATPTIIGASVSAAEIIDQRTENDDLIENVIAASPDPYTSEKAIYLQRRQERIRESDPAFDDVALGDEALPDIP